MQKLTQLLPQLYFVWQFGRALGHGDAVFARLQQFRLFVAGFGAKDDAHDRFLFLPALAFV